MKYRFANWRDPEQYPKGDDTTPPEHWKWEFIRRNPTYQNLYEKFKKDKEEGNTNKDYYRDLSINLEKNFEIKPDVKVLDKLEGDRISILMLPPIIDPCIVPKHLSLLIKRGPDTPRIIDFCDDKPYSELCPRETEVLMVFDISVSIDKQTKQAGELLKSHREREKLKPDRRKPLHQVKLQQYLRLLDAEAQGATRKEMAQMILQVLGHPLQAVHDGLKKAIYYRDEGFQEFCS